MLALVKLALRITTDAYDAQLNHLIKAALLDMGIAGVERIGQADDLISCAVITYCRAHFGSPPDYDRLKRSYDEQKAQLMMASGYTDFGPAVDADEEACL